MIFRKIENIANPVSAICLGTGQYGSELDQESSFQLLDRFTELGGNFIDTAHVYGAWNKNGTNGGAGNSEVVIGRWLKQTDLRKQVVIGTKGGHPDFDTKESGMTRPILLRQLQESLDRLQTDFIDIYWLHRDERSIPVSEIFQWLEIPLRNGTIRTLGFSNWRTDRLAEAAQIAKQSGLQVMSQISWSLAQSHFTAKTQPYGEQISMDQKTWTFHKETRLPVAAYNSQAEGFFSEKYDHLDFSAADFPRPALAEKYGRHSNLKRRNAAKELANLKGCTTNQIALAWLLHQPFPTVAIAGARTPEQLQDSIGAASVTLTNKDLHRLHHPETDEKM